MKMRIGTKFFQKFDDHQAAKYRGNPVKAFHKNYGDYFFAEQRRRAIKDVSA
jgi:hypothetical protein